MKIWVNDKEILDLAPGMKVSHALLSAELLEEVKAGKKIYDEWDNEMGLDGALSADMKIFVR